MNPEDVVLKAQDGVTTVAELEVGTADVDAWYAAREGKMAINYAVSVGHIPSRMAVMAPPAVRTLSRKIAPKTIQTIDAAITVPSVAAARTWITGTRQMTTLTRAVTRRLIGIATAAGKRSMTSSPRTAMSGASAARNKVIVIGPALPCYRALHLRCPLRRLARI